MWSLGLCVFCPLLFWMLSKAFAARSLRDKVSAHLPLFATRRRSKSAARDDARPFFEAPRGPRRVASTRPRPESPRGRQEEEEAPSCLLFCRMVTADCPPPPPLPPRGLESDRRHAGGSRRLMKWCPARSLWNRAAWAGTANDVSAGCACFLSGHASSFRSTSTSTVRRTRRDRSQVSASQRPPPRVASASLGVGSLRLPLAARCAAKHPPPAVRAAPAGSRGVGQRGRALKGGGGAPAPARSWGDVAWRVASRCAVGRARL